MARCRSAEQHLLDGGIETDTADQLHDRGVRFHESLVEASGVTFEAVVARGDPAHTLVELIERHACEGVVMGAHGKGMVRQALLGSVTVEMVHAAPVPVTLVKPSEATALDSDFESGEEDEAA